MIKLYEDFSHIVEAWKCKDFETAAFLLCEMDASEMGPQSLKLWQYLNKNIKQARQQITAVSTKFERSDQLFGQSKKIMHFSYPVFTHFEQARDQNTFLIVTPVLNAKEFIDETIESVMTQKADFDVFFHIQDGGSTDGTVEKIMDWENRALTDAFFANGRIKLGWCSSPDHGMYDAVDKGYQYLSSILTIDDPTRIISTWINADDLLSTNALLTANSYFETFPETHWLTGIISLIDSDGSIKAIHDNPKAFSRELLEKGLYNGVHQPCFFAQEGTFWRHSLYKKAKGLNKNLMLAGDWDLWRRFAKSEEVHKLDAVLAHHRRHEAQLSHNASKYYRELFSRFDLPQSTGEFQAGKRAYYDMEADSWNIISDDSGVNLLNLDARFDIYTKTPNAFEDTIHSTGIKWPKISIVTPSFNQGKFIRETIHSVIAQDYPNLEFIVIDGGSTDETVGVIREFEEHLTYWISEKDDGQSHAINKGFSKATGDILAWLNSDDQLAPNALKSMAIAFATSGADMVAGICDVYEQGILKHRHQTSCLEGELAMDALMDLDKGWNAGQFFYQPEVFFTRELWERAGCHVREDCYYSMDYELWCRFAAVKARLHVIGKSIVHFRSHPEQKTADNSKFKAELIEVQARFIKEWNVKPAPLDTRPAPDWSRKLRVAMINDHGYRYGAGIAHQRIAAAFDMAQHLVRNFSLKAYQASFADDEQTPLLEDIHSFLPDIVIFGNIHSQVNDSVSLVHEVQRHYPTFWLTHDFWLLTGRCAYFGGCRKYLTGCDASCPTADEYPSMPANKIASAWSTKRQLLSEMENLTIVANSDWSKETASEMLSSFHNSIHTEQIGLGVPTDIFISKEKREARAKLKISDDHFTIVFSVSALSDKRKGADLLLDALETITKPNITLILIGNHNDNFNLQNHNLVTLGYVENPDLLVDALNAADVFVGPSREETLGQVFLEAAMCGTPSIGFADAGINNAIVNGVTGIAVKAQSPERLAEAILHLYRNRGYLAQLSQTARLFAVNEVSIESCYRSFFNVLDKTGIVDRLAIPHKISFKEKPDLLSKEDALWIPLAGVSVAEGPYPEHGVEREFRWCFDDRSVFRINLMTGVKALVLKCRNPLFERQKLSIFLEDQLIDVVKLKKGNDTTHEIVLKDSCVENSIQTLEIVPEKTMTANSRESRCLSFMLFDIESRSED